jgi:hypothetical protein
MLQFSMGKAMKGGIFGGKLWKRRGPFCRVSRSEGLNGHGRTQKKNLPAEKMEKRGDNEELENPC